VVISGDKQILPARAGHCISPIAGDTMAGACDATQFLGIDVQQIAQRRMFVSLNRLPRW
jgi:hypothetical protein